jgi:hypothetical protein
MTEEELAAMERIVDDPNRPELDRMNVSFSLGQVHLNMGNGERAFARLSIGNCLKRAAITYDPDAEERRAADIIALFSSESLARLKGRGNPSDRPVFVFGMPRSGTTLVEQIIATHPQATGIGEPTYLWDLVEERRFLDRVTTAAPEEFSELATVYLNRMVAEGGGASRVVDKMTWNFLYAGLISTILPNARMIHCRRDPLDTCLSCYSMLFRNGHPYCYDLGELGRFYRIYRRITNHWRKVLPAHQYLEVDYESVVTDTETQVRRLLDFCRLPWDDACLQFHETDRWVSSASLDQVRKPVYTSSIGRAQKFREWLRPLEVALGGPSATAVMSHPTFYSASSSDSMLTL